MSFEHPYPDHAYLERDAETNEKRWFGSKGMGVCYVHEDRAAEDVAAAVATERERCAKIADDYAKTLENYPWVKTATDIAERIRNDTTI